MTLSLHSQRICFFGAGSMAEAILLGLIEKEIAPPSNISVINRQNQERLQEIHDRYGIAIASEDTEKLSLLQNADIIVLAMKPKDAGDALLSVKHLLEDQHMLVSVIAGLSISTIEAIIERKLPIVRTMPNTSSTIGLGATGMSFSTSVTSKQQQLAQHMFQAIGEVSVVAEPLLDVVTGVSGSGPAYIYYMMEAMITAGIQGGLSEATARQLTVQTVLGAASMVKTTGEDPAVLRKKVTSPNGTTQAALELLDTCQFQEAVQKAVLRASERAGEMGATIAEQFTSSKS